MPAPLAPFERVVAVCNPLSLEKHGLSTQALVEELEGIGLPAELLGMTAGDDGTTLKVELDTLEPETLVLAAGGDGTVNAVAHALAGRDQMCMAVLPLGTANDFARSLGIPPGFGSLQALPGLTPRSIDLGRVNHRHFINAAHLGIGVDCTRYLDLKLKRWLGPGAYAIAATRAWWGARPVELELCFEHECVSLVASHLIIGNGRFFGGGMLLAPEATHSDGLLDLHVLPDHIGLWMALRVAAAMRLGKLAEMPEIRHERLRRVEVNLPCAGLVNLDGELIETGDHLIFEVVPGALRVMAPPLTGPAWKEEADAP